MAAGQVIVSVSATEVHPGGDLHVGANTIPLLADEEAFPGCGCAECTKHISGVTTVDFVGTLLEGGQGHKRGGVGVAKGGLVGLQPCAKDNERLGDTQSVGNAPCADSGGGAGYDRSPRGRPVFPRRLSCRGGS